MNSLRAGLTVRIWIALAAVGGLCLLAGTWQAHRQTQAQMDYQMQQIARIVAAQPLQSGTHAIELAVPGLTPQISIHHDEDDDVIVVVRGLRGQVLYASASNRQLPEKLLPVMADSGFLNVRLGSEAYRVFVARSGERQIEVAQSAEVLQEAEQQVALATLLPLVLLLPVLAIVIVFTITRQLRPVNEATAIIATRAALSFDPVPVEQLPREVRPLVEEINRLLARLRVAVEREQRFVRDAAHALRTPLTALQLQADVLEGGRDSEDRAARLAELRAGIRRIITLSEQLLTLARTQTAAELSAECSELDPMLQDIATFYQAAATAKGISLQAEADSHAQVRSSRRRLTLVLGNLIDNAVRHTPVGGAVSVRARRMSDHVCIDVCDGGDGLPQEELERVFERFYQASSDVDGGSGLGLATVAGLVRQVHGEVELHNRTDRPGLIATVRLPLASRSHAAQAEVS